MASGDCYDLFISCAHSADTAARELNAWLNGHGLITFFDRSAFRLGLQWFPAHEDPIGRSKADAILVFEHGIGNAHLGVLAANIVVRPPP